MSNLDSRPIEQESECQAPPEPHAPIQLIQPRLVPLGGPRAMTVRRTLPDRSRVTVGAWCFLDHYGPDDVSVSGGMVVPPHPHTGLQTVSWLFEGEIEHRDSVGSHALVRPGELNLMTAGRGISHSEVSTASTSILHGVQLWTLLPESARHVDPFFERHGPGLFDADGVRIRVFLGSLAGVTSAATVFSPLVAAQIDLEPTARLLLPVADTFEHGVLVDAGVVHIGDTTVAPGELAYLTPGRSDLQLTAGSEPVRLVLIGGEPLGEQIVMWWNFIGRSHEEIMEYRSRWQNEVIDGHVPDGLFGTVAGYPGRPLPAPELPSVRLKPRG